MFLSPCVCDCVCSVSLSFLAPLLTQTGSAQHDSSPHRSEYKPEGAKTSSYYNKRRRVGGITIGCEYFKSLLLTANLQKPFPEQTPTQTCWLLFQLFFYSKPQQGFNVVILIFDSRTKKPFREY